MSKASTRVAEKGDLKHVTVVNKEINEGLGRLGDKDRQ